MKKVGGRWAEASKDESVADFVKREREQVCFFLVFCADLSAKFKFCDSTQWSFAFAAFSPQAVCWRFREVIGSGKTLLLCSFLATHSCAASAVALLCSARSPCRTTTTQGFEDMDETFLRNVSRLGNRFKGTELGGAHTGLAGEDEEEEVRGYVICLKYYSVTDASRLVLVLLVLEGLTLLLLPLKSLQLE